MKIIKAFLGLYEAECCGEKITGDAGVIEPSARSVERRSFSGRRPN